MLNSILKVLIVSGFVSCSLVLQAGMLAKSFAVFVVSYNSEGGQAEGGVAGTAFFVTPQKAITAYHVLQARSFNPRPGFEKVKVWLVHEGEQALEVFAENLDLKPNSDQTIVHLKTAVDQKYVFSSTNRVQLGGEVEAEGFLANSAGPELMRVGRDLRISAVHSLSRMNLRGQLTQTASISLTSQDVNLNATPCYRLNYQPVVGFSGGPVLMDGKVIGMNSFAEQQTANPGTWAVVLDQAKGS